MHDIQLSASRARTTDKHGTVHQIALWTLLGNILERHERAITPALVEAMEAAAEQARLTAGRSL